jgi:hypothetical protein
VRRPVSVQFSASRMDSKFEKLQMKKMKRKENLHGRTVCVRADHIAATVASWLAELDAWSPFVELLGRAVRDGDWAAIHAIADYLSVEVQVAA